MGRTNPDDIRLTCRLCNGSGKVEGEACAECRGTGKVAYRRDKGEKRELPVIHG